MTSVDGFFSAHWHGFPSLSIRLTCPRTKTFAFYSACDAGNKVQNCNCCTSLSGTCARSPAVNLFPLSLLGTSLCGWRPFRRVGTLTASPQLLITLPLGTLWGALLPVLLVSVVDITATSTRKFASAYHDVVTLEAVCCSNTKPLPSQTTLLADHTIWQRKCLCMQESLLLSLYSQLQLVWILSLPHWKSRNRGHSWLVPQWNQLFAQSHLPILALLLAKTNSARQI